MIVTARDAGAGQYLAYIYQDPVHDITDLRPLSRRLQADRDVFFRVEGDLPIAVLCVAYTRGLPDVIDDVLCSWAELVPDAYATHAIFYSVFRTDVETKSKNVGADLVLEAARMIQEKKPNIKHYTTMSPIPKLSVAFPVKPDPAQVREFVEGKLDPVARFHIDNGARAFRVISDADTSRKRQSQSWGYMANYDYTELLLK